MSNIVIDDYKDKRLDDTFFCVEATSNEVQHIWRELNQERGIPWKQMIGLMIEAGQIDIVGKGKVPVCVCLSFNLIRGKLICFYEATSQYVDHQMVEQWLRKNVVKDKKCDGGRDIMCDSNNTHMMLHAIEDSQKIWVVRQTGNKVPVSFDTARDVAQFLFNEEGEDQFNLASPYKISYGPKDVYKSESDLSREDIMIINKELNALWTRHLAPNGETK